MIKKTRWRFDRPESLEITKSPSLKVNIFVPCRSGQEKLNLTVASLAAQDYPAELVHLYIIDDGSSPRLTLPEIRPLNTTLIYVDNTNGSWGKASATNYAVTIASKADVYWFLDSDMVVEASHLSHHMKWHHEADDYLVLGWKNFVRDWEQKPGELYNKLSSMKFNEIYNETTPHLYWEARVGSSNSFQNYDLENFRGLVGATFSMSRASWEELGGYNKSFITSEDIELGWRALLAGLRFVPEREAQSYHLGINTIEDNKETILKHNAPMIANKIPALTYLRKKNGLTFEVPEQLIIMDARNIESSYFINFVTTLLKDEFNQTRFLILGNWLNLTERYSPLNDDLKDLREIFRWINSDTRFTLEEINSSHYLSVDEILSKVTSSSTPFIIFNEGKAFEGVKLKDLKLSLLTSKNGLEGFVSEEDERLFILFTPAIATARRGEGSLHKNLESIWGVSWLAKNEFKSLEKSKYIMAWKFAKYAGRRVKQVRSPGQLYKLFKRALDIYKMKIFRKV